MVTLIFNNWCSPTLRTTTPKERSKFDIGGVDKKGTCLILKTWSYLFHIEVLIKLFLQQECAIWIFIKIARFSNHRLHTICQNYTTAGTFLQLTCLFSYRITFSMMYANSFTLSCNFIYTFVWEFSNITLYQNIVCASVIKYIPMLSHYPVT